MVSFVVRKSAERKYKGEFGCDSRVQKPHCYEFDIILLVIYN